MNVITDPAEVLPAGTSPIGTSALQNGARRNAPNGEAEAAGIHTLRRTGHRAVRFDGWQLLEAVGAADGRQVWHDLNLYRTVAGSIVVELIVHKAAADRQDLCRVETFKDLAAAAAWLEAYRAADDATIPAELGAADTPLPWAVLQAVQLRQRVERIELEYRALLSDVFAALDLTEPADGPI